MKHILNEMSEDEKNLIRQQHTGGMKVNTERFNKLIESKSGDVKPLISEQTIGKSTTQTPLIGKTVNFYSDPENKKLKHSQELIKSVKKINDMVLINVDIDNKPTNLTWKCTSNEFKKSTIDSLNNRKTTIMYNTNLNNRLKKLYCSTSSGGVSVPQATFASTTNTQSSGENFA